MKRFFLLVLAVAAGCSDSGVGPQAVEVVAIHLDAGRSRDATVVVGDSVRLTARTSSTSGASVSTDAVWRSENPGVVRLSPASPGVVHAIGESFGNTRVIATSGATADTVMITVTPAAVGQCDGPGLELAVGQSVTTTASTSPRVCLAAAPAGGAEYVIVPFNSSLASSRMRVEISGEGIREPAAAVRTQAPWVPQLSVSRPGPSLDHDFDRRLRQREARELAGRVRDGGGLAGARLSTAAAAQTVPVVGDTLRLNVNANQACSQPKERAAVIRAISQHAIFAEDTSNPAGGFSAAEYQGFATEYDQLVHPTMMANFGAPSDIDNNGRVIVLYTAAVNELTEPEADSYVGGFFYARDLFPKTDTPGFQGCAGSNAAEMFYMLAPDPTGAINGHVRTREFVGNQTVAVIAHELQHLINAARRLYVLGTQNWFEDFWLNEGLSHLAEELIFYAATPHEARQNINITTLREGAGVLTRFNQYQASNFGRLNSYLRQPDVASPVSGSDLATRGAAWSFLRYAADRRGGDEKELWRRLIDSELTGHANLMSAIGTTPMTWMHDWLVSLYVDDLVAVPARFQQPSWNGRSILPAFTSNAGNYPLRITDLRPGAGATTNVELVSGTGVIVRASVGPGSAGRFTIGSGGGTPAPGELRYTVVRVR